MSVFHRVAASLMCAVLSCGFAVAQEKGKAPPAPPVYVVAKVADALSVMTKEEFDAKKKSVEVDNAKAKAEWEKAKKDAEAAKKPFSTPMPKPVTVEQMGGEYKSKADAEAAMNKLKDADKKGGTPPKGGDAKKGH
jgi:hypothetical protein